MDIMNDNNQIAIMTEMQQEELQVQNDEKLCTKKTDLQEIIANAILLADEKRRQRETDKQKKEYEEWRETVGYKRYSKSEVKYAELKNILNDIKCSFKTMFMSASKIKGSRTISFSLKLQLFIHYIKEYALRLAFAIILAVLGGVSIGLNWLPWYDNFLLLVLAILFLVNALRSRIFAFEVDNITDDNYLFAMISMNTNRLAIYIAVLSLILTFIVALKQGGIL